MFINWVEQCKNNVSVLKKKTINCNSMIIFATKILSYVLKEVFMNNSFYY